MFGLFPYHSLSFKSMLESVIIVECFLLQLNKPSTAHFEYHSQSTKCVCISSIDILLKSQYLFVQELFLYSEIISTDVASRTEWYAIVASM